MIWKVTENLAKQEGDSCHQYLEARLNRVGRQDKYVLKRKVDNWDVQTEKDNYAYVLRELV